jgi:hypothetical protein
MRRQLAALPLALFPLLPQISSTCSGDPPATGRRIRRWGEAFGRDAESPQSWYRIQEPPGISPMLARRARLVL